MSETKPRYVVCLRNDGAEDLEVRKLYRVVPDASSAERGYLRIVDESGEDYLYPAEFFADVDLPKEVERALTSRRTAGS